MAGYYDYVLGVIPAVMFVPVLTAVVFGFSVQLAVIAGGAIAVPFVGHALFVRAPTAERTPAAGETPTDDAGRSVATGNTASAPAGD